MITITDSLVKRVAAEREKRGQAGLWLRVAVDSGGCSGFQYAFTWDLTQTADDTVYGAVVIVDDVSIGFLKDATIDFVKTLMGEDFKVLNPMAVSGCGCGNSFAV